MQHLPTAAARNRLLPPPFFTMAPGSNRVERLAGKVAEAAERLTKAFDAEYAIGKKPGDDGLRELIQARNTSVECAAAYADAMREYIELFESMSLD